MTPRELAEELADRLRSIDELTVTVDPGVTITAPMATVFVKSVAYNATMGRGTDDASVTVTVYASAADTGEGTGEIYDYAAGYGAKSIRSALESTPSGSLLPDGEIRVDQVDIGRSDRPDGSVFVSAVTSMVVSLPGTAD